MQELSIGRRVISATLAHSSRVVNTAAAKFERAVARVQYLLRSALEYSPPNSLVLWAIGYLARSLGEGTVIG